MNRQHAASEIQARSALRSLPLAADSMRVGRTHRVVRERAMEMQEARRQGRTLWLPLTIASAMLAMICYTVWSGFAQYDVAEISEALTGSSQMMILGLWFLPVTATALFFAWLRHNRNRNE